MAGPAPQPSISLVNTQRRVRIPLATLRQLAPEAVPLCLKARGPDRAALLKLPEVVVAIVSDAAIARLHREFGGVPGPTDVITFQHGEIIISADTAARQARANRESLRREILRYVVHGLLHLNGHRDGTAAARRKMWTAQERIIERLAPQDLRAPRRGR
jgi:probable rRNA maturation factor